MTLPLDILQGIGLACAAGIRPFLPALLTGALARGDLGVDFSGTDFAFLESPVFLLLMFLALIAVVIVQRRVGPEAVEQGPVGNALAGIAIGIGALLFAGTLADHGYPAWAGILGGIVCAADRRRRGAQRVRRCARAPGRGHGRMRSRSTRTGSRS